MKKLVLLLLFIPLVSFGQTPFEKGFKAGFKKGYCGETFGCIPPQPAFAPQPSLYFTTYSDGYSQGIIAGKKSQNKNNQLYSPSATQKKSGQNALISGARDLGRSNIPTYTPNTNSYSASTRKSPSNQYTQTRSTNNDLRTLKYLERVRYKNELKIIKLKYKGEERKRNILDAKIRHKSNLADAARTVLNR